MSKSEQAIMGVIVLMKQNPDCTIEETIDIVSSVFPGEGAWRLDIYIEALWKAGAIDEATFKNLKEKILKLDIEALERIKPAIMSIASDLIEQHEKHATLLQRKVELEELLKIDPRKTKPDEETLECWNTESSTVQDYLMNLGELEEIIRELEET